ncbi:DNA polymerase [Vibrio phage ICP1]|nr:DNA polymerase [Vibrio phage ICP1]
MKGLYIFDSEGDGLCGKSIPDEDHITKFHTLLFKEYGKDNWNLFLDFNHPDFQEAKKFAESKGVNLKIMDFSEFNDWVVTYPTAIACQNLEGFDMLAFSHILGTKYEKIPVEKINGKEIRVFDTLSMSRGLYPDRPLPRGCPAKVKNPQGGKAKSIGPHSLEAWGVKVANKKVAIEDWKGLPLWKYVDRVWEDVIINELQWNALIKEMQDGKDKGVDWKMALKHNLLADHLMQVQEEQGVVFREDKALELVDKIDQMMKEIEEEVEPKLPPKRVPKSKEPSFPANPFDKSGKISHHGLNFIEKYYDIFVDREAQKFTPPPKTAFKATGEVSVAGKRYCVSMGIEDENLMADFIREQKLKAETISVLSPEDEERARALLAERHIPEKFLFEPMRLSNQDDIKEWLVTDGKWNPTLFRTKDVSRGENKQNLPEFEVEESCWEYILEKKDSVYLPWINQEMGVEIHKITSRNHPDFKKVVKKARFLVTSPKLKDERGELCPNLEKIDGEMASKIVKWLSLRNRRSVIKAIDETKETGWLNHPRLKKDGKLPARYSGLTNTNRRKHSVIANIPGSDALLGHEMRSLFTVPEGFWQVGIDGSNLEGFCAANAAFPFDNGAYYRGLGGDPHTENAKAYSKAAGRTVSRSEGKGITYGVLYGAQAAKVSSMLGISKDQAQNVINAFWDTNYGLKGCKEWLEKYWESTGKKYILGIDKRKIWTRSKHSLLNAYLQSMGAIGMDLAGILWHERALEEGLLEKGVARIIYYHDEYQLQVPNNLVRLKEFDTGINEKTTVESVLKLIDKAAKLKDKGEDFDSYQVIGSKFGLSETQVENVVQARSAAKSLEGGKFVLSGNIKILDNGNIARAYCRAGELMVKCIEDAYKILEFNVPITGEYLMATPEEGWGGSH